MRRPIARLAAYLSRQRQRSEFRSYSTQGPYQRSSILLLLTRSDFPRIAHEAEIENPDLRAILQERVARALMEICSSDFQPDHPSREFATSVAQKATDWLG